ncbi:bifunctional aspartate transaminase/aspartate 4-decarboxylase [Endozoicomonadaceae bacterium StTr2]
MDARTLKEYDSLSPFEFKDKLLNAASSSSMRMMLNAGRGNPNFLATDPRRAFLQIGDFALQEAERSYSFLNRGFGGLPEKDGMLQRFEMFMHSHEDAKGMRFIQAAISLVKDQLGLDPEAFLYEMVTAFLGCYYPEPVSMLHQFEPVIKAYIKQELYDDQCPTNNFRLFACEGGTAAMSYIFQSLRANGLLDPEDKIALGTPIFTPYLEIPLLSDYQLEVIDIEASEECCWQMPEASIRQLEDPSVKLFCLVNPSNPSSVKINDQTLQSISHLLEHNRPDLMIVTDDVYATFADNFGSLLAHCPYNTLCVYSFSKYFGATGWRQGVIALHDNNVFDNLIHHHSVEKKQLLRQRYSTITEQPDNFSFIDRLVADSRSVALHHSAGLSSPQQLQMTLFALSCLIDSENRYKQGAKRLIQSRYETLYQHIGITPPHNPENVGYYTLLDLEQLATSLYGEDFARWFVTQHNCPDFLFRLAEETGIVLLPAKGFEVHHPSVRVSLANLTLANYRTIGQFTRQVLNEFFEEFSKSEC